MNLLNLLEQLRTTKPLHGLYREQGLSEEAIEAERVTIYMVGSLQLQSSIKLVDAEEVGEQSYFQQNGIEYVYFFRDADGAGVFGRYTGAVPGYTCHSRKAVALCYV